MCGDGSTDRVIFTGALIGTQHVQSDKILDQLQDWVKTEPTILVQGVHLKIAACVVRLKEAEKPQCIPLNQPSPVTEGISGDSGSGGLGLPIYIGIAGGAFLLLICITITLIVVVTMRRRQKGRSNSRSVASGVVYGAIVLFYLWTIHLFN